jgi:hypothetical protein
MPFSNGFWRSVCTLPHTFHIWSHYFYCNVYCQYRRLVMEDVPFAVRLWAESPLTGYMLFSSFSIGLRADTNFSKSSFPLIFLILLWCATAELAIHLIRAVGDFFQFLTLEHLCLTTRNSDSIRVVDERLFCNFSFIPSL